RSAAYNTNLPYPEDIVSSISCYSCSVNKRTVSIKCDLPDACPQDCLNGGFCGEDGTCDCSEVQGNGTRCQTVLNMAENREGICRSWGQYHFETFDGIYFYFPGKCSYILAKDCRTAQPQYVVQVHNSAACTSSYSCSRSISLFFPNEEEIIIIGHQVMKGGIRLKLPQMVRHVFFERLADYILVKTTFGFSLAWDGLSGIYIKLTVEHKGKSCGLCGNYNGDMSDDLNSSMLTEDIAVFGNSWMSQSPSDTPCEPVSLNFPSPCRGFPIYFDIIVKCEVLVSFPFFSCRNHVQPNSYVASCINDLCTTDDSETYCRSVTEYTRACSHAGYPLREWRDDFPACIEQCEESLVHRDCISCCPPTCTFEKECLGSSLHCLDGCYCPDGLIMENGTCISVYNCPCIYHGAIYPIGSHLQEGCNECICSGGVWNCTDNDCPAECSVTGDMHFTTFDGRIFTFLGTCQYIFAKSHRSNRFTATLQNVPCGQNLDHSCIQSVTLLIDEDTSKQITLTRAGEIQLGVTEIRKLSSIFVQVKTTFGLRLQFDKEGGRLYLQVDSSWKGGTVGLCGTFNGNLRDDFLSPAGMIEGTPQLHANAWKISSACVTPLNVPLIDPCDTNQQNALYSSTMCDILNQELFAPCHSFVNPSPYYQRCRYDACKCGRLCMCTALGHYASLCAKHRIRIDFRSVVSDCGVICQSNMLYHTCSSSCGRTCQSLSINEVCSDDCAEGCNCPNGTFYHEVLRHCVLKSQCSCQFLGGLYQSGEVTFKPDPGECPDNKRYFDCRDPPPGLPWTGTACEITCENLMMNLTCPPITPCMSGCVCPPGLVRHGGDCFLPDNCPCRWKGQEYLPGEVVSSVCYTCVCQRGLFNCTYHPCPEVCTIYNDRHYRTFDGLEYDYVSDCQVYLVKVSNTKLENVSTTEGDDFQLWKAGYYVAIHFPMQEIIILWDKKTTVHIQVGPQWRGKLMGMCGNFDKSTANDMTTSNNMEVSNTQAFGDSWALGQCVSRDDITRPCEADLIRQPFAKRECAILFSEVFAPCHNVVDVTWFYKNCLTDTCNCNRGGDCECFCTSVAAYAHKCCQKGISVNWRSPSVCPFDCEFYNRDLGEGPYVFLSYLYNNTVIGANITTGDVFPCQRNCAGGNILINFMIAPGLYKGRQFNLPIVSFESAERPNYFLHAGVNGSLRLEKWRDSEPFWKESSFIQHHNKWISGYSTFELYNRKGAFVRVTPSFVTAVHYDYSDKFKLSSSFAIEGISTVIPYRTMCEFRHKVCASPCIKTCSDPHGTACKFLPLVEGCMAHCPKLMLLDEVTRRCYCVFTCSDAFVLFCIISLQCTFNVTQPSCGFLGMPLQVNSDKCCPQWECPCRCSMFSDLHIITFDGNDVGVYDAEAYVLTLLPQETIVAHIEQCSTREVPGGNSGLCFKKLNITSRTHKVLINRLERTTTVNSRHARLPFTKLGFHIVDTGTMYLIHTPAGVTIQWYRSTGIIVLEFGLPSNRTISTKGLCGCCNGSPADDLKLPNGTFITEVENIGLFLESWMVETSGRETDCFRCRKQNCTTANCTACFEMLNQSPWTQCHQQVTPEIFCELWIRDFHYTTHQCDALAVYAAACNKYNICIQWRTPNFCPLSCPMGMEYQPCVPACESKTCQNKDFYLENDSTCLFISESCVCPYGTVLHQPDSNYCVTEQQCACTDNEGRPRSASETWNGSQRGCCMQKCLDNGTIIAVKPTCSEVSSPICEREGEVVINVIEEGVCCPKKICECNLTICGNEVPACENGNKLVIGYSSISCCPDYRCGNCCTEYKPPVISPPECREDQFLVEVRKDYSCCFSFQCVCESCIDPIPICSEGEILAVDLNSTNRCCPLYHCVCDANMCPPPDKSCESGTKLVKKDVPEICCPEWQCGNDHLNLLFVSEKDKVCLFQGVTVLKPGQSMIQSFEGELCHTVNCLHSIDPVTEFHSMEINIVACSEKCEPHQVYIPSSDPHFCCGSCKNISCPSENESGETILNKAGTSWVSNCIRYECLETAVGVAILGSGVVCPPFNDTECIQNGGIVKTYVDGCCKTCNYSSSCQVNVASCDGKCPSAVIFNSNINGYAKFCKCCREGGLSDRIVPLFCTGNSTWIDFIFQEPTDCSCRWN
uniref:Otogelin like n=1 Tax=Callorhinchus milii TaxID=7868 RepID=A0A4W3ISK9_CALMI